MTDPSVVRTIALGLMGLAVLVVVGLVLIVCTAHESLSSEQTTMALGGIITIGTSGVAAGAALLAKTSSTPSAEAQG